MSNCLLELDEPHYRHLQRLENNPAHSCPDIEKDFHELLKKKHVLVEAGEEEKLLMLMQYRRNCSCYGQKDLSLTICPTLACNFDCGYCFEGTQSQTTVMSDQTIEKLLEFIREKAGKGKIHIDWYGGEPTLAFDIVEKISQKILDEGLNLDSAQMTTNGYLLDQKKIETLNDLKIDSLQITLDGPKEIHDSRRQLRDGRPTFDQIIANIDTVTALSYDGKCDIRVNIDKNNMAFYAPLREKLLKRYSGKKVVVYAARIKSDTSFALSDAEWAEYCINLYKQHGIITKYMLYPKSNDSGLCIAHFSNSFVAGPSGELYKCWEDVGIPQKTIGNVCSSEPLSNHDIPVLYTIGTDQYANGVCRKCTYLPICKNACPRKRLKTTETCTHFKEYLIPCMEITYDIYKTAETSCNLLNQPFSPLSGNGYRIIYPAKEEKTA